MEYLFNLTSSGTVDPSNGADFLFATPTTLESAVQNPLGRAIGTDLKLIGPRKYSLSPRTVSTKLYPQAAFGALSHVNSSLSDLVAVALLNLSSTNAAAVTAGFYAFRTPESYVSQVGVPNSDA